MENSILKNFDFFNKAFINFEDVKDEMRQLSGSTHEIQKAQKKLKMNQLVNMIQIYRLQRKKINSARIGEILRYITVLQQSIPVIDNLISNPQGSIPQYDMALDLIKQANDLISSKMEGIKVTEKYKRNLAILKQQCVKKIEEKRAGMLNEYLQKLI